MGKNRRKRIHQEGPEAVHVNGDGRTRELVLEWEGMVRFGIFLMDWI